VSRFGRIHVLDDIREGEAVASILDQLLQLYLRALHCWHLCLHYWHHFLRFLARELHKVHVLAREICGI
jgi:hypothetical protein